MMNPKDTITLYFKDGSSDKFYTVSVEEKDGGYVVPFVYGRRGTAGAVGDKSNGNPVPYEKAKKMYDSVVNEKMAKGYTPGENMKPYAGTAKADAATGINCQLLTEVSETEIERLVKDANLVAQEKFNGKRMLLLVKGGKVKAINRKGLECGFPSEIEADAKKLPWDCLLDGECVGTVYYAFDILEAGGMDLRQEGVEARRMRFGGLPLLNHLALVPTATTTSDKKRMYTEVKTRNGEGVVFKRKDAKYRAGITETWLKVKFWASASCLVTKVNDKRSVALGLLESGKVVPVGNCTIPANANIPKTDDIVEIRYLYAHKGGSIYQPQYEGVRDDLNRDACQLSQLKYKPEGTDDDA